MYDVFLVHFLYGKKMKIKDKAFKEKFLGHLRKAPPEQLEIIFNNLLKEKTFLTMLLDNIPDGIIVTDEKAKIIFINDPAKEILSLSFPKKILGEHITDIINIEEVFDKDKFDFIKKEINIKNKTLNLQISKLKEDNSSGYIYILKDITQEKISEHEIRQSEKIDSLSTLTAGLAHDIKNPLNSLNIHTQLIHSILKDYLDSFLTKNISEKLKTSLSVILKTTKRITDLVDQLIVSTRPDSLRLKPVSVNRVVEKIAEEFRLEFELKKIQLILDLDPEIPENPCDKDQIERCFLNLIHNAIEAIQVKMEQYKQPVVLKNYQQQIKKQKAAGSDYIYYTSSDKDIQKNIKSPFLNIFGKYLDEDKYHGILIVKTYIKDKYIFIDFQDNGCGISEENMKKVFDPYFTTKFSGSGLGLTLVHQVIKEHNGQIQIYSKADEGTIVTLSLPLMKKPIRLLTQT